MKSNACPSLNVDHGVLLNKYRFRDVWQTRDHDKQLFEK